MRTKARALALAPLLFATSAAADDVERADALFKQGQALVDAGRFEDACPLLAESHRLDPKLGRLLNLAFCHEQEGKSASAWSEYNDAAALATQRGQAERAGFARAHADAVAKKLAYVRVEFPKGRETVAELTLDSAALARDRWGAPVPVDPGKHTLVARASERVPRTLVVDVPASPGTTVLDVLPLEVESASAASGAGPAPREEPRGRALLYASLVVGGVGLAGLGVGATLGVLAAARKGDADPHCPMKACDPAGAAALGDARTFATAATAALIAGGALTAAGVLFFVLAPRARVEPRRARVEPLLGPSFGVAGAW